MGGGGGLGGVGGGGVGGGGQVWLLNLSVRLWPKNMCSIWIQENMMTKSVFTKNIAYSKHSFIPELSKIEVLDNLR